VDDAPMTSTVSCRGTTWARLSPCVLRMLLGRGRLCCESTMVNYQAKRKTKKQPSELTNLQYSPHALQFNSSFSPRLHKGVCVAPQLVHSALMPPGAELPLPLEVLCWRSTAELTVVAVAPGPEDLVDGAPCVLTVSVGRPTGVPARLENKRLILDGATVSGRTSLVVCELWEERLREEVEVVRCASYSLSSSSLSSLVSLSLSWATGETLRVGAGVGRDAEVPGGEAEIDGTKMS
jgi:hypothetical protein